MKINLLDIKFHFFIVNIRPGAFSWSSGWGWGTILSISTLFVQGMVKNVWCFTDAPRSTTQDNVYGSFYCWNLSGEVFPLSSPQSDFLPPQLKTPLVSRLLKFCISFIANPQLFCPTHKYRYLPEARGRTCEAIKSLSCFQQWQL